MSALQFVTAQDLKYRNEDKVGDYAVSKIHQRAYVINALCSDQTDKAATALAFRMMQCSTHHPCNQPFCPMCRHNQQQNAKAQMLAAFSHVSASQLRFLTILHSVHYNAAAIDNALINKIKKSLRNLFNDLNCGAQLIGAFEIEAFSENAVLSNRKLASLTPLGFQQSNQSPFFLLHFHAVVNIGALPENKLLAALKSKKQYPHSYQVLLQQLRSDKSHADNLETLASYMLKYRLQYSDSLKFSDDQNAQYKRTVYKSLYAIPIAKAVVMSVNACNKFNGMSLSYQV